MNILLLLGCPDIEQTKTQDQKTQSISFDFTSDNDDGLLNCKRGTDNTNCYVICSNGQRIFWSDLCPETLTRPLR